MSQRRNLLRIINDSNRNPNVNDRQSRTSVFRDFNESILFERLIFTVFSSSSYVENDVKKEHEKEESIDNENVDVQLVKLQRKK